MCIYNQYLKLKIELNVFPLDRQWIILDNRLLSGTAQPEDVVESNCKDIFKLFFEC